jgi:hypothetical protein
VKPGVSIGFMSSGAMLRSIGVTCIRIDLRQMEVGWSYLGMRQVRRGLDVPIRHGSQLG